MALTRDFKETIRTRAQRDATFRRALLGEAVATLLSGDVDTGKAVLRDYINATAGFKRLAEVTRIPVKSLMRMLGPAGNPSASNLFAMLANLQALEGVYFEMKVQGAAHRRVRLAFGKLDSATGLR